VVLRMATEAMARLSRANPLGGVSHSVTGIQISPGSDDAHGFSLISMYSVHVFNDDIKD